MNTLIERFESKFTPEPMSGCWLWTGAYRKDGYGAFYVNGKIRSKASRVSFEIYNGIIPAGMSVLHTCDMPSCVNPHHLFLGTQKDNMADMFRKGRDNKGNRSGEINPMSKLDESDVLFIRLIRMYGVPINEIAIEFNIKKSTVSSIINRQSWKHI